MYIVANYTPISSSFLQLLSEFRTASDERAGPGNEASFLLVNHDLIWFPDHSNGRGEGSEIGNRSRFLKWHVCVLIITCKWRENTAVAEPRCEQWRPCLSIVSRSLLRETTECTALLEKLRRCQKLAQE